MFNWNRRIYSLYCQMDSIKMSRVHMHTSACRCQHTCTCTHTQIKWITKMSLIYGQKHNNQFQRLSHCTAALQFGSGHAIFFIFYVNSHGIRTKKLHSVQTMATGFNYWKKKIIILATNHFCFSHSNSDQINRYLSLRNLRNTIVQWLISNGCVPVCASFFLSIIISHFA